MNNELDLARIIPLFLWGFGTFFVYAAVTRRRYRVFRKRRDVRSRREFIESVGLFMTALGCAAAVALILEGNPGSPWRMFSTTLALGGFTATGVIMLTDRKDHDD